MKSITIFISYSWSTPDHENWVLQLGERLIADGINVMLDKWDLKEGHDKFSFMESMVNSTEVHKVLIILDKRYAEKANSRNGGVGTETQIISSKVYANVSQEKFVPIIVEKASNGEPYLPAYLESRIYIDFSSESSYEDAYEKLLRNLYQRPSFTKPTLGKAPSYLFELTVENHKSSSIVRRLDKTLTMGQASANSILREFLDVYYDDLKKIPIPGINWGRADYMETGKAIIDTLASYLPLKNDFVSFFEKITKIEYQIDVDIIIKFFENTNILLRPLDGRSSWIMSEFDIFKFIIHELFIYVIACSLKNENYSLLADLLYSSYFFKDNYDRYSDPEDFTKFNEQIGIINNYYKEAFSEEFISPMADLMIKRLPSNFNKEWFLEADLLCHYIAKFNNLHWFPTTYVYKKNIGHFELFRRLDSLRHFNKVKILFHVTDLQEFKAKFTKLKADVRQGYEARYEGAIYSVPPLIKLIKLENVATLQ